MKFINWERKGNFDVVHKKHYTVFTSPCNIFHGNLTVRRPTQ